jgi:hypothetical protein
MIRIYLILFIVTVLQFKIDLLYYLHIFQMGNPLIERNEVNELFFWEFVSNVNYPANHKDLDQCINYLQMFPVEQQKQICDEMERLKGNLYLKYNKLDTEDIYLSDDRFGDALAFAVSLGEYEYYTILNEESYFLDYLLQGYNKGYNGFCESFDYVFYSIP